MRRRKPAPRKRPSRLKRRAAPRPEEPQRFLQLTSALILAAIAVSAAYFAYRTQDLAPRNPASVRGDFRAPTPERPAFLPPKY
jgi:hypothetical protein